jgi:hypothetical protein
MADLRLTLVYGPGGVGKTAFMLRAAEALAAGEGPLVRYHACRPGEPPEAVAHALLGSPGAGPAAVVDRLAHAALSAPLALCLDDAHHLGADALEAMLELAARRLPLWVFLASRAALPVLPERLDHLVVRLGPLGPGAARALVAALQELYGAPPATAVDHDLLERGGASPLQLKLAFSRAASAPYSLGLAELPPLAAEVLAEVCAARRALPRAALMAGRPRAAAQAAIELLADRFLVDADAERVGSDEMVRAAVLRSPTAPAAPAHRRCLAHYLDTASPAQPAELEVLFHAVACGAEATALAVLEAAASGAAAARPDPTRERDLARAIDALAPRLELPPAVRLLRARIRAAEGEVASALADIATLAGDDPLLDLDRGRMAYALGRLGDAEAHLARALGDTRLEPPLRLRAFADLAATLRAGGEVARAERLLEHGIADLAESPGAEAARGAARALLLLDCESYARAADAIGAARRAQPEAAPGPGPAGGLDAADRAARAAAGHPLIEEPMGASGEDALVERLRAQCHRAGELGHRGDLAAAARLAAETSAAAAARGLAGLEWAALACWAGAQPHLGHPREVAARAEAAGRAAAEAGHHRVSVRLRAAAAQARLAQGDTGLARQIAAVAVAEVVDAPGTASRLRAVLALADVIEGGPVPARPRLDAGGPPEGHDGAEAHLAAIELMLWDGRLATAWKEAQEAAKTADAAGWCWLACRARLLAAEAAFRLGHFSSAVQAVEAVQLEAEARGYGVQALRARLLAAGLARTAGDREAARRLVAGVAERAAAAGFQAEREVAHLAALILEGRLAPSYAPGQRLVRRFALDEPPAVTLRTESAVRWLTSGQMQELDVYRYDLLVDLPGRRVKVGKQWVDFARRRSLFEVVRVLAAHAGTTVPVADLVSAAWGVAYHPIRHQSRVVMTVSRLREALGRGLVAGGKEGYALVLPAHWAVATPLAESEEAGR